MATDYAALPRLLRPANDSEYEAALGQLRTVLVERDEQALARSFNTVAEQATEWQEARFLGGWLIYATPDEIRRFSHLILTELDRLRRPLTSQQADARPVHISFRALHQPQPPTLEPSPARSSHRSLRPPQGLLL